MRHITATQGFAVSEEAADHYRFTYQQARYTTRALLPSLVGSTLLGLVSLFAIQPRSLATALIVLAMVTTGLFLLIKFLYNLNRKERTFVVGPDAIECDGKRYLRRDIHAIFLQEGMAKAAFDPRGHTPVTVVAVRPNLGGFAAAAAMNAGQGAGRGLDAAGDQLRKNVAALSCRVMYRYGNNDLTLVRGVTRNTAELIIQHLLGLPEQSTAHPERSNAVVHKLAATAVALLFCLANSMAQDPQLLNEFYAADGYAYTSVADSANDQIYVAGGFSRLRPGEDIQFGVQADAQEGWPLQNVSRPNDYVRTCVPDGTGGWFIGGDFTQFGSNNAPYLARVNGDGSMNTSWSNVFTTDGPVYSMVVSGNTLYVAGDFDNAGGAIHQSLVAYDIITGQRLAFHQNLECNGRVNALAVANGLVYCGGTFTTIAGVNRTRLAALDPVTGVANGWSPAASADVLGIASNGAVTYAAGNFQTINGTQRFGLAAIDGTTGTLLPFNASPNTTVYCVAVSSDTVFAGGTFTQCGGAQRRAIAALNASSGTAYSWDPNVLGSVRALLVGSTDIVAVGNFSSVGIGADRRSAVSFDRSTGTPNAYDPQVFGEVFAVARSGNGKTFLGGSYLLAGSRSRPGVGSISLSTGRPTPFRVDVNGVVNALLIQGDTLFLAGPFTQCQGATRNGIAAVDRFSGVLLPWQVNIGGGEILSMVRQGSSLLLGGTFASLNGLPRSNMGAVGVASASVDLAYDPGPNGWVYAMEINGTSTLIGGSFTSVDGVPRTGIASLSTTGAVNGWAPNADGVVRSIVIDGNSLWVCGGFQNIGGAPRGRLARIDASTGAALPWTCNANNAVFGIAIRGDRLYCGGDFTQLGGQPRFRLASVEISSATPTTWSPDMGFFGPVYDLARVGDKLFTLGDFDSINSSLRPGIGAWSVSNEDISTAVMPVPQFSQLNIYPNPAKERVQCALMNGEHIERVELWDDNGRIVKVFSGGSNNAVELYLEDIAPGLYIVRVLCGRSMYQERLCVTR